MNSRLVARLLPIICSLLLATVTSCEDDDGETPVFVSFANSSELHSVKGGTTVRMRVYASAQKGVLSKVSISSFDNLRGVINITDTTVNTLQTSFVYYYNVPILSADSVLTTVTLRAENDCGQEASLNLKMLICGGAVALSEKAGLMLYTSRSGRPNALRLNSVSQPFILSEADTATLADIYVTPADTLSDIKNSVLRTQTDISFVRANSFNYSDATSLSVQNVYESSLRSNVLYALAAGDIIVVGRDGQAWGVMLIQSVIDNDGENNDFFIISYKSIDA